MSEPCYCGGVMFGDGNAHLPTCPCFEGEPTPPATPQPETPTLQSLARELGWGSQMTDAAIWAFAVQREHLLRVAQGLLETHKSHAATAEAAIRERISRLRALSPPPDVDRLTRVEVIDENGRAFTRRNVRVELSIQDNGRTLKVFVTPGEPTS